MLSTFRVLLQHPPGLPEKLAPCVLQSSFQLSYIWADRAQIFCYKRTVFNTMAANYLGHLTTASRHVSFIDGSNPFGCMSHQPARLLQKNDTLSFISPTLLAHTHARASNPWGRKREITDLYSLTLHIFSLPPFHKTTLLFPRRNGGWELVIFLFQIKGWQKKNPIHVIVFPYCLH